MLVTMMYLLHNNGKCLDDIRGLHDEKDLLKVFGVERLPSVRTFGNFLHRWGGRCYLPLYFRQFASDDSVTIGTICFAIHRFFQETFKANAGCSFPH